MDTAAEPAIVATLAGDDTVFVATRIAGLRATRPSPTPVLLRGAEI
jgi:hypothetical protein